MIPRRARQQRALQQRGRRVIPASLPAPIGGWNERDSLSAMPATDAETMDNFFPGTGSVTLRNGYSVHVTNAGTTNVDLLAEYHDGTTNKLIAGANGKIYDVTTAGSSPTALASGFSENRWQHVNFNGSMGLVNGTDSPQTYDGSSISAMTVSGSGLTTSNLIGIAAFRSRTYFFEDSSQDFWYSATNALGGSLTKFPLSRVGQFGGKLKAIGTWSVGGNANATVGGMVIKQLISFIMSSGEIIIYDGSNPGDASDWTLVGVYRAGAPLDVKGVVNVANDLIVLTVDGAIPMGVLMRSGRFDPNAALTDKIRGAFNDAARAYKDNTGWQAFYYPSGPWLLVNIPTSTTVFHQYVMNPITGAWCRFKGMNARSWSLYKDNIYFGGTDGTVYRADNTNADNGSNIAGVVRQAYSDLGANGQLKHVTAARPVLVGSGSTTLDFVIDEDFRSGEKSYSRLTAGQSAAIWDQIDENWEDWDDNWNSGTGAIINWLAASAFGYWLAPAVRVEIQEDVEWLSTEFLGEIAQGLTA